MKFAVIGLGNLGKAMATNITRIGHEVLGVDKDIQKLESIKHYVSSVVSLDTTDKEALQDLSLDKMDGVFVTFSKDFGTSIQTVALLKSIGVAKLIVRSMSEIHETVLRSIGVDMIISPEKDFAEDYSLKMLTHGMFEDRFVVGDKHEIISIRVPQSMIGESISKERFETAFHLDLLCVRRPIKERNIISVKTIEYRVQQWVDNSIVLQEYDQLVVFGDSAKIKVFGKL